MFTSKILQSLAITGSLGAALLAQPALTHAAPLSSAPAVVADVTVDLQPEGVAANPNTGLIYTTGRQHNTVTVVDGKTDQVAGNILLGGQPHAVAVLPALNRIFATSISSTGFGSVAVIDGASKSVMTYLPVGFEASPASVAVNSNTGRVYVTSPGLKTLTVIDGLANAVVDTIHGLPDPADVAVNPATNRVYVTNLGYDTLSTIDGATDNFVGNAIKTGNTIAVAVAVNPTTNRVYVGGNGGVAVVDGNTNSLITSIPASGGDGVYGIAVDAIHNRVFASTQALGTATVIDGNSNSVTATLQTGPGAYGVDYDPNAGHGYVANTGSSTLSVIGDVLQLPKPHPLPCEPATCI